MSDAMANTLVTFCRLTPETADCLARIAPGVFDGPVEDRFLAAFLASEAHEMIVALAGDLVVGMISGVVYLHPDKPPQLWINEVGTAEAWRRRGIARALVQAMLTLARLRGCAAAWLGTEADNLPARALYRRTGAREVAGLVLYDWAEDT